MDYGKRTLALLLTLAMLLTLPLAAPGEARAVSWIPPEEPAAPFRIDVNVYTSDKEGGYRMVAAAAAAKADSLFYAVHLELPSVADANAYYGNAGLVEGSRVGVLIEYHGCAGLSEKFVQVPLTSKAQSLWFQGDEAGFVENGQGSGTIWPLTRSPGVAVPRIHASVHGFGKLKDIMIGGCYSVQEKGLILSDSLMRGMLFKGGCADSDIFLATNESHMVNGLYVIDRGYKREILPENENLFQMTSATTVNCETNEGAYLNTLNHVFSLLGFGYADIAAGEVYLSDGYFISRYASGGSVPSSATLLTLSDAVIGGCYGVSTREFKMDAPCVECAPVNLAGYLISGDCGRYDAYFTTNATGLCTGVYVVGNTARHEDTSVEREAMEPFSPTLYGWAPDGEGGGYHLAGLPAGALINPGFTAWQNSHDGTGFAAWCSGGTQPGVDALDWSLLYYSNSPAAKLEEAPARLPFVPLATTFYANAPLEVSGDPAVQTATEAYAVDSSAYYAYNTGSAYSYGNLYMRRDYTQYEPAYRHALLGDGTVEGDSAEKSYLNSARHLLSLLGYDIEDVLDGSIPMSPRWLLDTFGFTLDVCDLAPLSGLRGDVNRDNTVSLADAVLLARHLVGSATLSAEQLLLADVDAGGEVNVADVTALCGALVGGFVIPPL